MLKLPNPTYSIRHIYLSIDALFANFTTFELAFLIISLEHLVVVIENQYFRDLLGFGGTKDCCMLD